MKTIISLFLILTFVSCNNKSNCNTNVLKENNIAQNKAYGIYDVDTIRKFDKNRYYKNVDPNEGIEYIFKDANGYNIRQFEASNLFVEYIQKPEELFYLYNEYNKDGVLKRTGLCQINGGFQFGIWKLYDDSGILIKEVDHEKPYKFTWKDVLDFAKKEDIDLNAPDTYIVRVNNTIDGKYWNVSWNTKDSLLGKPLKTVLLDGDNGKILSETYYEKEE